MDVNIVNVTADDARPLDITIGTGQLTANNVRRLYSVLRDNPGMCPVTLVITATDGSTTRVECGDMFRVANKNELVAYIKTIFGVHSVPVTKRRDLTQESSPMAYPSR